MNEQKESLREKFSKWHEANPHVYEHFERFTRQVIATGRKKCGAWLVINRIRWFTEIETHGGKFKISNDFIALYARMFMERNPEHAGFFTTKPMKRW